MSELQPRGVFRPTTCRACRGDMFTDTAWDNGQLVLLDNLCPDCSGQPTLFGGVA